MAHIEVQPESGIAHASVSLQKLAATAVTINEGFAGETGPVLLRLAPRAGAEGEWDLPANATLSAEQLQELRQGRLYALASSAAHPMGEIRGQLTPANVVVRFAELAPNTEARALGIKASGVAAATSRMSAWSTSRWRVTSWSSRSSAWHTVRSSAATRRRLASSASSAPAR